MIFNISLIYKCNFIKIINSLENISSHKVKIIF